MWFIHNLVNSRGVLMRFVRIISNILRIILTIIFTPWWVKPKNREISISVIVVNDDIA